MGGTIKVIARQEDGSIIKMHRWTNSFPSLIKSPKLITSPKEHFDKYMEPYLDMKKDWNKNHKTEKFKLNMTPVYFPEPKDMGPVEYGILVVDFKEKKILSIQGYSHVKSLCILTVVGALNKEFVSMNSEEENSDILELFEAGRFPRIQYYDPKKEEMVLEEITKDKLLKIANSCKNIHDLRKTKYSSFANVEIDLSPWESIDFEESAQGYAELKSKMISLGFEFTEKDEAAWKEWVEYRYSEAEENR